jgi:hypothetical protein
MRCTCSCYSIDPKCPACKQMNIPEEEWQKDPSFSKPMIDSITPWKVFKREVINVTGNESLGLKAVINSRTIIPTAINFFDISYYEGAILPVYEEEDVLNSEVEEIKHHKERTVLYFNDGREPIEVLSSFEEIHSWIMQMDNIYRNET